MAAFSFYLWGFAASGALLISRQNRLLLKRTTTFGTKPWLKIKVDDFWESRSTFKKLVLVLYLLKSTFRKNSKNKSFVAFTSHTTLVSYFYWCFCETARHCFWQDLVLANYFNYSPQKTCKQPQFYLIVLGPPWK